MSKIIVGFVGTTAIMYSGVMVFTYHNYVLGLVLCTVGRLVIWMADEMKD